MSLKFKGVSIFVSSIRNSRWFYNTVLGLVPVLNLDEYIAYENGFAIWDKAVAGKALYKEKYEKDLGSDSVDFYFESEDIESAWEKVSKHGPKIQSGLEEESWGGKRFRLYDPDEYLIEVGESLYQVVFRLRQLGLSEDEIKQKVSISEMTLKNLTK